MAGSGNDKDLKIGIVADTADAEKAKRALEGVKEAAESAAVATRKVGDFSGSSTQDLKDYIGDLKGSGQFESLKDDEHVVAVLDELAKREKALAEETAKATAEIKKQTAAQEESAAASDKQAKATAEVADNTKKVTEESQQLRTMLIGQGLTAGAEVFGKMASGLRETADSLKQTNPELAETLDKTSKISGSLSTILSGAAGGFFIGGGPGAVIGGVTAAVAELGTAWVTSMAESGKAIEEAGDVADQTAKRFGDMVGRMRDVNREAESGAFKKFADDVAAGAEVLDRQNEQLERNLRLTKERIAAQGEIDRAETERRIAEVEGSDLSPEEKIRKVAGLRDAQAQRDSQRKISGLDADVDADAGRLRNAQQDVIRLQEQRRDLQQQLQAEEAKQKDGDKAREQLEAILGEGGTLAQAAKAVEAARQRVADSEGIGYNLKEAFKEIFSYTGGQRTEDDRAQRRKDLEDAEAYQRERATTVQALRPIAAQSASVDDARKELERVNDAEKRAGDEANRLARQLEESRARRDITVQAEQRTTASEQAGRRAGTNAEVAREVEKQQDEALRKAKQQSDKDEQARKAAEREQEQAARGFEAVAQKGEGIARKQLGDTAAGYFEKARAALADGASSEEVKELLNLLKALAKMVDDKSAVGSEIRTLQRKVRELEGKNKTGGDVPAK